MQLSRSRRHGSTLVEIMIVVSVIALLAAIAVPSFLRARKRAEATIVLNDLRLLDAALAQFAIDNNKTTGTEVTFADLQPYLKQSNTLYNTGRDIFGNDFGTFAVDSLPLVPTATWRALSDVANEAFWSPYYQERTPAGSISSP